jgi:hypothetical protein
MLGERAQRHGSRGSDGHRGSMSDMTSVLHQSVSINPKGDIVDYLGWLSLMSTLEESLVANSGSTKVWVMDPSLFDV